MKKLKAIGPGLFFLAISAFLLIDSFKIKIIARSRVSSAVFPRIIGVMMAVLSIALIVSELIKLKKTEQIDGSERKEKTNGVVLSKTTRIVLVTFALIAVYTIMLTYLGFIIATAIYLFAQIMILATKEQRRRWYFILVFSVAIDLAIYYSFYYGFSLILPSGKLF